MTKKLVANDPAGSNPPSNAPSDPPSDLPINPPSNLSSALLPQNAGSAETVPRVAPAPVGNPPMVMLGQPIAGMKPFHELASLVPEHAAKEYARLRADIQKNGLLEPITVWDGKILDGRNREKACRELGIEPLYVEYTGDDPVGFVISKNFHRRQLTPSQVAMLALKLASFPRGRPDFNSQYCGFSQDETADRLGVSRRLVQFAQKVYADAIPEVVALVEAGTLTADKAAALAKATPEQQRDAVAAVERGEKYPTFTAQKDSQGKASKPLSSEERLVSELKAALQLIKDSPERSDALIEFIKTLSDEAFAKKNPREEFLQGIMAECAEYGVLPPAAGTET